jgi:hypothetical protein
MTLFHACGLYVGWDRCGAAWLLRFYNGSAQLQAGRLLLGCDWFFRYPCVRNIYSTPHIEDRRCDVETLPHSRAVSDAGR